MADPRFKRGAIPSSRHKLLAAEPHRVLFAPPPQFAVVPSKLDMWGNDVEGDCVSAEEAFAIALWSQMCTGTERFMSAQAVMQWAAKHGFANGANLTDVMDARAKDAMVDDANNSDLCGPYTAVDYSNPTVIQSAGSQFGSVKIAIDANALPQDAGNKQGWYGLLKGNHPNTDHCIGFAFGYGEAGYLYDQLKVSLPSAVGNTVPGYYAYTWHTIGFVTQEWLMGTCTEGWSRNPTILGMSPTPGPAPNPGPTPTPPPPKPIVSDIALTGLLKLPFGMSETITLMGTSTPRVATAEPPTRSWLVIAQDLLKIEVDATSQNWTALLADLEKLKADWMSAQAEEGIGARNWIVIAEDLAMLAMDIAAKNVTGILADLAKLRTDWTA